MKGKGMRYVTKKSKRNDAYRGGATRDARQGKGRFDLITPIALTRLAGVYERGGIHRGDRNWEKGIPLSRFLDSALRHLSQYLEGYRDEDHLAQAAWNIFGLIHTEEMIRRGKLPKSLNDLPKYR